MDRDNQRPDRGQRYTPGRFPAQQPQTPGMAGQPMAPPPGFTPQGPGMEGQPRTAPPNFIPEAPGMDRRSPNGFGMQYQTGTQARQRDLRRCINRFTYVWMINGNNFWFYPTFLDRQFVYGFRWRRNRWEYDRINMSRIIFFRCF